MQAALEDLASRVEQDPVGVLRDVHELAQETLAWSRPDASLWCVQLAAQALRFTDRLEEAVHVAAGGMQIAGDQRPAIRAHLALEAGSSLNQAGEQARAEEYLREADRCFALVNDAAGRAWAGTALADALCGLSRAHEAASLTEEALALARMAGDVRIELRALKQLAVVQRQLGHIPLALAAIDEALDRTPLGHSRGNVLLEQGHILSQSQQLAAAEKAYLDAATIYASYGDGLGLANVYRALGNAALLLGRFSEGVEHLRGAAGIYEDLGNRQGLGYTLRDLAIVHIGDGDHENAERDAVRAVGCFRDSGDLLGLSGALRAHARVLHVLDRPTERDNAVREAVAVASQSGSDLAVAGAALIRAEMATDPTERREAAEVAAAAYRRVGVPLGAAHAHAFGARAAWDMQDADRTLPLVHAAHEHLHEARRLIADGSRRADLDFTARDVTRSLLDLLWGMNRDASAPTAAAMAMDIVLDDLPLGLRRELTSGELSDSVHDVITRISRVQAMQGIGVHGLRPAIPRHLSQQLAIALTALEPGEPVDPATLAQVRAAEPDAAVLAIGAPTTDWKVPVCFALPGGPAEFMLVELDETDVDHVDGLGRVGTASVDYDRLAGHKATEWMTQLAQRLLPPRLALWVAAATVDSTPTGAGGASAPSLRAFVSSALAHLPIEALDVAGIPLGVRVAVARIPAPPSGKAEQVEVAPAIDRPWHAYLDDDLTWAPERNALEGRAQLFGKTEAHAALGQHRLILIGSHGAAGPGLSGGLYAGDGSLLLDSADLLGKSLEGSVVVLESCWSGRFVGPRTGEQVSMATVALLAGAKAAVAGIFPLPADDECTGRIVAALIDELTHGTPAPEAARRARANYWASPPHQLRRPTAAINHGTSGNHDQPAASVEAAPAAGTDPDRGSAAGGPTSIMSGRSPLAWAGLCVWVGPN